jgi:outer membrane protein assembly factor BamB
LDYRRRWQLTRLRRTRQRLGVALGALALLALTALAMRYARHTGAVWTYTPPRPGLAHFSVRGLDLCAVWDTGRVVALEVATGRERPHSEFRRAFPFLAPPLLASGRALVGSDDGRLRCLDLSSGQALWEHRTGGAVRSQPVLVGNRVLFGSDDGYLYCVDFGTGARLWRTYCGGPLGTAAAITGDRAVVGTVGYGIGCVSLAAPAAAPSPAPAAAPADLSAPERWLWGVAVPAPVLAPPLVYAEGKVAVGTDEGALYLLDAVAGRALARVEMPGLVRRPPALVGDRLVVADSGGEVRALAANGSLLWSRQVSDTPTVGLTATESAVYLGTAGGEVLALRAADGTILWRRDLPGPAAGSLEVNEALVLVGLDDGRICAFRRPMKG